MTWINGRQGGYQIKTAHLQGTDVKTIVSWMALTDPKDLTVDADTYRFLFIVI
ncbi:hypothetical protein DPMN_174695 [Dreissena polymorpha]|uniref:Uncharacterized protein n=1 Tax=Dreissena polymorpha TaxID=45954 RepID=A0A9D4E6S0_DREPO|nr:hypothetical protein DPMN_174695 [Dreissena polymorpha]